MKALGFLLLLTAFVRAETTPMNQALPEEKEITITCQLIAVTNPQDIPVFNTAKDSEAAKGTYHYTLWLPKGYHADPQRRWPCLFIASAIGNAKMGKMAPWLKANGYIAVMLVESKNGPWEPIVGNFLAAHDDVVRRVRIQEGLKFATGMSGGARACSVFVQIRPGFSGLILQGAGGAFDSKGNYHVAGLKRNTSLCVAMTMGETDNNKGEVARVKTALGSMKFLPLMFNGGHTWAPQETFEQAIAWIEHNVYDEGPVNSALRPIYFQRFKAQVEKLPSVTDPLERYRTANNLLKLAQNRNLNTDPAVAPILTGLQAEIAKLRTNPKVANEIMAEMTRRR
ncbi:MAG: hypothetical protein FJ395_05535 [Verrucomicrobia bacterium]|nr:hypothetical protein [Verrucomicrobiota bacterium]